MRSIISSFLVVLIAATHCPAAFASCGSATCPIDVESRWEQRRFSLDITQQYLDQNQPRAGTENVSVGFIPSEEDEVRTINRITQARATWRPNDGWIVTGALPYVNRTHEHIRNEEGMPPVLLTWNYEGFGDTEVAASRSVWVGSQGDAEIRLNAGVKLPTGKTQVPAVDGEQPEPSARPGTGSWDGALGSAARWLVNMPIPGGGRGSMPVRLGVLGRWNGVGTEDYRVGHEVQAHLGADYPILSSLELLLQGNVRSRGKDEVGGTSVDSENTGGTWAYLTPGLRFSVNNMARIYGLVQIPVYQRVNGIQIVSNYNVYMGVTRAMF